MNFTIDRNALLKPLGHMYSVVERRNTIPILSNVLIETNSSKVSLFFNLKLSDMNSSRRSINIARPRQIAMYYCKALTSFSYPEIGKAFGGKDHTTVMHAVKKIDTLSLVDIKLKKHLSDLKKSILSIQ